MSSKFNGDDFDQIEGYLAKPTSMLGPSIYKTKKNGDGSTEWQIFMGQNRPFVKGRSKKPNDPLKVTIEEAIKVVFDGVAFTAEVGSLFYLSIGYLDASNRHLFLRIDALKLKTFEVVASVKPIQYGKYVIGLTEIEIQGQALEQAYSVGGLKLASNPNSNLWLDLDFVTDTVVENSVSRMRVTTQDWFETPKEAVLLINHNPFSVANLRKVEKEEGGGEEIAQWASDDPQGHQWRYPIALTKSLLPPQAIGEQMERGSRFWIDDNSGNAKPVLNPSIPLLFRFSRTTQLSLIPIQSSTRRYQASPMDQMQWMTAGTVEKLRWEMAYPLEISYEARKDPSAKTLIREISVDLLNLVSPLPNIEFYGESTREKNADSKQRSLFFRDLLSDGLGRWFDQQLTPEDFKASITEYQVVRSAHLAQLKSFRRRLAQFPISHQTNGVDSPWQFGLEFEFRGRSKGAKALKEPLPTQSPSELPSDLTNYTPGVGELADQAIGLLHTFEFAPELFAVLRNPKSTVGSIFDLKLSALGATGSFEASFDYGRTTFQVHTRSGYIERIVKSRIGRIAATWNRAKHVIVYERSVSPSAQFSTEQGQTNPITLESAKKAKWGWPILRKAREFVEILEPIRIFESERGAENNRARGLHSCDFKTIRIFVNGSWGRSLEDGYEMPLFNPLDTSGFYIAPEIALRGYCGGDQLSTHTIKEQHEMYFYSSTKVGETADSDLWESRKALDCDDSLQFPPLSQAIFDNDAPTLMLANIQPTINPEIFRNPRFTIAVESDGPLDARHGEKSIQSHLLVRPKFLSIGRSRHQLIPVEMLDITTPSIGQPLKNVILGKDPLNSAAELAANLRSISALLDLIPIEIARISESFKSVVSGESPLEVCNRAKVGLQKRVNELAKEAIDRLKGTFSEEPKALGTEFERIVFEPIQREITAFRSSTNAIFSEIVEVCRRLNSEASNLTMAESVEAVSKLLGHSYVQGQLIFFNRVNNVIEQGWPAARVRDFIKFCEGKLADFLVLIKSVDTEIGNIQSSADLAGAKQNIQLAEQSFDKPIAALKKLRAEFKSQKSMPPWVAKFKSPIDSFLTIAVELLSLLREQISLLSQSALSDIQTTCVDVRVNAIGPLISITQKILNAVKQFNLTLPSTNPFSTILGNELRTLETHFFDALWIFIATQQAPPLGAPVPVPASADRTNITLLLRCVDEIILASKAAGTIKACKDQLTVAIAAIASKVLADASVIRIATEENYGLIDEAIQKARIDIEKADTFIRELHSLACGAIIQNAERKINEVRDELNKLIDAIVDNDLVQNLDKFVKSAREKALAAADWARQNVEATVAKYYDEAVKENLKKATELVAAAGTEWDKYKAKADAALKLTQIFSDPPELPQIDFNTVDFTCVFSDVEKQIMTSACVARIKQADAALNELGLAVPFQNFLDSLIPTDLKTLDFNKVFKSLAGCNFEDLFKKFKLPDLPQSAIKIKHGVDGKKREAWVDVDVDHQFTSIEEMFGIGPISFSLNSPKITAHSRSVAGLNAQSSSYEIMFLADWLMQFGGNDLVTFAGVALRSDTNSGIRFDVDPSKIKLHPSLEFVTNALKSLTDSLPPSLIMEKDERGNPIGAKINSIQEFPGVPGFIGPFALAWGFGIRLENGNIAIRGSFGLGDKAAPVLMTLGIYSGGAWLGCAVSYSRGIIDYEASFGLALGSSKSFNLAQVARGKYSVLFYVEATFSKSAEHFAAGISMQGSAKIIGYLNANVSVLLAVEYEGSGLHGRGELSLEIEVSWFYTFRHHSAFQQKI
jgi:hypothetical protein